MLNFLECNIERRWSILRTEVDQVWSLAVLQMQSRSWNVNRGGGGCLFIYSCSARLVSFQIDKFEFDFKRN